MKLYFFHRKLYLIYLIVFQFSSVAQSCLTLYDPMNYSTPGLPVHHQLPEPSQTRVHWVGDATQPSHPLSSPSPPAFSPSQHQGLSDELALHFRWPKYWSFSFSISPSNEYTGLISFRIDWFDLLAVQGTLKSLLQHHSSKASILWHSAFFTVQLSYPYVTTGKTIALTRQTFVSKVMSLLFNMLSRLVIAFLPRMDVRVGLWRKLSAEELVLLNCGVGEDSWESLGLQGDPTSPFWRRSALGFLWKEWC